MKRYFLLMAIAATLAGCSTQPAIESESQKRAEEMILETSRRPESVVFKDSRTVYVDDSLCIAHYDIDGQNAFGKTVHRHIEYVGLTSNGVAYEYLNRDAAEDSVYLSPSACKAVQHGTIYEDLPYNEAIRYRAILAINQEGRMVADHSATVKLQNVTGTADWQMENYRDEFGEETASNYVYLKGNGTFSNSAATNEKMSAVVYVDQKGVRIRLIEYRDMVVKQTDYCQFKIKDADGVVYELGALNNKEGYICFNAKDSQTWRTILAKEGLITCNVSRIDRYLGAHVTHLFRFDSEGYDKAIRKLR